MSIKEWKPEYEKLTSNKLSLLGVTVLKEFENGIRIIQITGSEERVKPIRLINMPIENKDIANKEFGIYKKHIELELYEVSKVLTVKHTPSGMLASDLRRNYVMLNGKGEIVSFNTSLKREVYSFEELYKIQFNSTKELIEYIDAHIWELYIPKENRLPLSKVYNVSNYHLRIKQIGRYLTVYLSYNENVLAMLLYDIERKQRIVKTLEAILLGELGKRESTGSLYSLIGIVMKNRMVVIVTDKGVLYDIALDTEFEEFTSEYDSLMDFVDNYDYIRSVASSKLRKLKESEIE